MARSFVSSLFRVYYSGFYVARAREMVSQAKNVVNRNTTIPFNCKCARFCWPLFNERLFVSYSKMPFPKLGSPLWQLCRISISFDGRNVTFLRFWHFSDANILVFTLNYRFSCAKSVDTFIQCKISTIALPNNFLRFKWVFFPFASLYKPFFFLDYRCNKFNCKFMNYAIS